MPNKNKLINIQKDKSNILKEVNDKIKLYKRIETACRDLCLHNDIDPDRFVCKQMPELLNNPFLGGFYLPNPQYTMPAWWLYRETVEQALNILEATKNA